MDYCDWQLGDTFEIFPWLLYQLFTFDSNVFGSLIPTIYSLLPNTAQTSSEQLFAQIGYWRPKMLVTVFEVAITNSAEKYFTWVEIKY